jgi:cobalamin synthase
VLRAAIGGIVGSVVVAGLAHGRFSGVLGVALRPVPSQGLAFGSAQGRLGGFTGDVLGAAGVVCETVGEGRHNPIRVLSWH